MNIIQRTVAVIALAVPVAAAAEIAEDLEKKALGYWAPDIEAMTEAFTEKMGLGEEDAAMAVAEFAKFTVHVEPGKVHLYTEQGTISMPYEILEADKAAKTLTLRAVGPPDAPKSAPVKIAIKDDRIDVQGGQTPFVLGKIDEDEFKKRKAALPAHEAGP